MDAKRQEEVSEMEINVLAGSGWGGGPWFLFFPLLWIGLFAGVFILFFRRRDRWQTHSAEEILAERYAKGEISAEEYRQRLGVLQRKGG
jgi:putative membrane protein